MKKCIIIPIIIVIISLLILIICIINSDKMKKEENNTYIENEVIGNKSNTMIIELNENRVNNEKINEKQENRPKTKTASQITQEIYKINGPIGKIEIPSTKVNLTILSNVTVDNLEKSPCFLYTTGGINKKGTTLIVGHNKRNGKLFSNNAKIKKGDKIYITDLSKNRLEYTVYSKIVTTEDDTSYIKKDTKTPEIVLSSCTDDGSKRIIIIARAND